MKDSKNNKFSNPIHQCQTFSLKSLHLKSSVLVEDKTTKTVDLLASLAGSLQGGKRVLHPNQLSSGSEDAQQSMHVPCSW